MSFAIYTDPAQIPPRITRVTENIESVNFKGIPDVIVLDDSTPDLLKQHEEFRVLFKEKLVPEKYLTLSGGVVVEMKDAEKAIVDAEEVARAKAAEDARIASYDDLFNVTKPTDFVLAKVYGRVDSLKTIDEVKNELKIIYASIVKGRTIHP